MLYESNADTRRLNYIALVISKRIATRKTVCNLLSVLFKYEIALENGSYKEKPNTEKQYF